MLRIFSPVKSLFSLLYSFISGQLYAAVLVAVTAAVPIYLFEGKSELFVLVEDAYSKDFLVHYLVALLVCFFAYGALLLIASYFVGLPSVSRKVFRFFKDAALALSGATVTFAAVAGLYSVDILATKQGVEWKALGGVVLFFVFGSLVLAAAINRGATWYFSAINKRICSEPLRPASSFTFLLINFFLSRVANSNISSSDPIDGIKFWVFAEIDNKEYVVLRELDALGLYMCLERTSEEEDKEPVDLDLAHAKFRVQPIYGYPMLPQVSPLKAILQAAAFYPAYARKKAQIWFWWQQIKDRRSYERCQDRIRVLNALIDIRNNKVKEHSLDNPSFIRESELKQHISSPYGLDILGFELHVKPVLDGLVEEGVIDRTDYDCGIRLKGSAWSALASYYAEERKHQDSLKLSRWQVFSTLALSAVTALTLKDEFWPVVVKCYLYFVVCLTDLLVFLF